MTKTPRDRRSWQEELSKFREVAANAARRTWRPASTDGVVLSLRSSEIPAPEAFATYREVMAYAAAKGSPLKIVGGGYGCFDLELEVDCRDEEEVDKLVEDKQFQVLLSDAGTDFAEIKGRRETVTYAQYFPLNALFVTNRRLVASTENPPLDPLAVFGVEPAETLSFGTVEVIVPSSTCSKKKAKKSFWSRLIGVSRTNLPDIEIDKSRVTLLDREAFAKLLTKYADTASLTHIHGYANDFPAAVTGALRLFHNIELSRIGIVPVIFSWPSRGNPAAYDADANSAEQSESALQEALGLIQRNSNLAHVLAHSHGNKLLVRALSDIGSADIEADSLGQAFLCAPDVDNDVLQQKLQAVLRVFRKACLYMSDNDLALQLAEIKALSKRAGRNATVGHDKLDIVDASAHSTGLLGHAYYAQAKGVLNDLYYALLNMPAAKRKGLKRLGQDRSVWLLSDG